MNEKAAVNKIPRTDVSVPAVTELSSQPKDMDKDFPCVRVYRLFGYGYTGGPAKVHLQIRTGSNGYAHAELDAEKAAYIAELLSQYAAEIDGLDTTIGWERHWDRVLELKKAQRAKKRAKPEA